jgi:catechol 2,3-dioxygenase-like lactoylglutathione lyase family enzyme
MPLGPATPILRIFDVAAARAFYVDWLGFEVVFEHRFGPEMPLYLGLRRDGVELHLSEHHGDTTPGTRVRIAASDLDAFHDEISARPYPHLNPGRPCRRDWGERDLTLTDPFGNRLTFHEDAT